MPPRTGQKRTAPSSAPEGSGSGAGAGAGPSSKGPKPKKTRFADPSEDPAKFAEDVDSALEDPLAKRKGRVRNEGYDSDSTDDGEGVVLSRRTAAAASGAGDDDDMFTLVENQPLEKDASGKKKEDYLRLGDIEGQEFGAESDSGLSSEENEPEDEDDAERRKKAGMGFELSSFNMREEMEEGKFSADGTYVRSFDPHGVHDRWMEEFNEKDIKMARRRKKQRERQEKEKLKAEARELEQSGGKDELQKALIPMLKKGETVLEALQRLGAHAKQNKPALQRQRGKANVKDAMRVDKPTKGTSDIDHITHLASNLMSLGDTDVYSRTYEELVRSVRSSGKVDASWEPPSADVKYEYKWSVPTGQTGEVFGPFSEDEVKLWFKASYFGPTGEKVKIRQVGGQWGDWSNVVT